MTEEPMTGWPKTIWVCDGCGGAWADYTSGGEQIVGDLQPGDRCQICNGRMYPTRVIPEQGGADAQLTEDDEPIRMVPDSVRRAWTRKGWR